LDAQFLVVTQYGNTTTGSNAGANLITVLHLADGTRQTFSTGDPPLGVAFLSTGQAMIVTTTSFLLFDPATGRMQVLDTISNLAQTTPVSAGTFPGQILQTALTSSADGSTVWGIGSAGTGNQIIYHYDTPSNQLYAALYVSSPALLPRVSVSADGRYAMVGWSLINDSAIVARYPNVISSKNITGHAIDSKLGIVYAQIPDASQPTGPPVGSTAASGQTSTPLPALLLMDVDNLTVRDRLTMPENLVGRAVLNSSGRILYAISDSGVMVLPVGSLNQFHRVTAAQEDLLMQTTFCNRNTVVQSLTITDPGGGNTDFTITPSQKGVTVSPSSGMTPATVQVRVDPSAFQSATGTTAVMLNITSNTAVNQPHAVRALVNVPSPAQHGTIVNVPGTLTDILPDPGRNRYYVLRQDLNQLLVFDGATNKQIQVLRTATTPSMMSMTIDNKYLLVGHNDSTLVTMYDLDSLQPQPPIVLPHYARSIAASNSATLVLARNEENGQGIIDTINFVTGEATPLPSLGAFTNTIDPTAVLTASPNGRTILLASPDGTVALYSADANTFTTSRKDLSALSGAFAASSYDTYVVGNYVFNSSLVPTGTLNLAGGNSSGFAFVNQGGYLATAASAASAGMLQNLPTVTVTAVTPMQMTEAPLLPSAGSTTATGTSTGTSTGSGTTAGSGSGSISVYTLNHFTRTVAPLPSAGTVIALTTSGITVLAANYNTSAAPVISSVVSAGDGTPPVAPGGLISVFGQNMSSVNMATSQLPLPTALGGACLSVNGTPVPLLFVSGSQINAQLPYNVGGTASMALYTSAGTSNSFSFGIQGAAPSIFMSGTAGPMTGLATIVRSDNNQLVTPTNPIHPNDTVVIYLTGMGATTPPVDAGVGAPSSPLAEATAQPAVTLGGAGLNVSYAGLVAGEVGVYQINASVPFGVPQGMSIPLVISQGGATTSLNVRVVK
jgi:uncharacterized protein (TIGR03437 family)